MEVVWDSVAWVWSSKLPILEGHMTLVVGRSGHKVIKKISWCAVLNWISGTPLGLSPATATLEGGSAVSFVNPPSGQLQDAVFRPMQTSFDRLVHWMNVEGVCPIPHSIETWIGYGVSMMTTHDVMLQICQWLQHLHPVHWWPFNKLMMLNLHHEMIQYGAFHFW